MEKVRCNENIYISRISNLILEDTTKRNPNFILSSKKVDKLFWVIIKDNLSNQVTCHLLLDEVRSVHMAS